ncbi:MAG: large conductance mechanosensitive channel protein MscL [Clostridiales bacterium]|nr:large conductance mechanosensitive channel protein MscL [Clostridiales bacterium]
MKKFFGEFKKFITRGNVLDMSVGVIVGGAFTGIVNGLSNYILKPLVNWLIALCLGSNDGLKGAITMLSEAKKASGEVDALGNPIMVTDLAHSIYIDWGAFISAIINFIIIAFVLFLIVKLINSFRDGQKKLSERVKDGIPTKEERKMMKKDGIKLSNKAAVKAWLEQKEKDEAEAEAKAKAEAEEKAKADRLANPTTEDLLKDIKELLKNQAK